MMTNKEILKEAYTILEKPCAWGKGHYSVTTSKGTRYCLQGAVRAVTEQHFNGNTSRAWDVNGFLDTLGYTVEFNDKRTTTKTKVLKALKRAIRKAA